MVFAKIMKSLYFFFLSKIRKKKVIGNVLYRKLAFLEYKNNDLKKSKNLHFSRGGQSMSRKICISRKGLVHAFGQNCKISLFLLFLGKKRQKKCLVTLQIENQHFQTIKTWIKKTVEELAIFQRGQSIVSAKIMKFLYFFFLGKIRQKTCLVTFQIENKHFQTIKTWI